MGVCVYTPAFALNAGKKSTHISLLLAFLKTKVTLIFIPVTGFELWGAVLATGLVCTLYTTLVSVIDSSIGGCPYRMNLT